MDVLDSAERNKIPKDRNEVPEFGTNDLLGRKLTLKLGSLHSKFSSSYK